MLLRILLLRDTADFRRPRDKGEWAVFFFDSFNNMPVSSMVVGEVYVVNLCNFNALPGVRPLWAVLFFCRFGGSSGVLPGEEGML